jgi:hypothetical protein
VANKVEVKITATNAASPALQNLSRDLAAVGTRAKVTSNEFAQLGNGVQTAAGRFKGAVSGLLNIRNALVALPFAGVAVAALKMASDVVESENLYTVSLGQMADAGREWSDSLQKSLGLNAVELRKSLGIWQSMFTAMGMGTRQAYAMSTGLTQLTNDLASFYNFAPEEMFQRLQSAISGEIEPMRRLGVDVSDNAVDQWRLAAGIKDTTAEMSNQQKVLIRYALLLDQTKNAQGDLARTADSTANQFRRMQSELAVLGQNLGALLLPIVGKALAWINNEGIPGLSNSLDRLKAKWAEMSEEGQRRLVYLAALMVGGGPLIKAFGVVLAGLDLLRKGFALAFSVPLVAKFAGAIVVLGAVLTAFDAAMAFTVSNMGRTFEAAGDSLNETGVAMASSIIPGIAASGRELAKFGVTLKNIGQEWQTKAATTPPWWERLAKAADFSGLMPEAADFDAYQRELEGLAGRAVLDPLIDQARAWSGIGQGADAAGRRAERYGESAAAANQLVVPTVEQLKAEYDALAASAQNAGASQVQAAVAAIDAMVAVHPATLRAAAAVEQWQGRIEATQAAIRGNQEASKAASRTYQDMQERLSAINDELSKQRQHLSDLASPRLTGMGAMDAQQRKIEDQIKRLRLSQLALYSGSNVNRQGDLRGTAKRRYDDLQRQIDAKQRELEKLQIGYSLKYDEQVRKLKEAAAGGAEPERTYQDYMKDIKATRDRILVLTKSQEDQEQSLKAQQKAMEAITASGESLNEALRTQQDELKAAQETYRLITSALQEYFTWILKDRDALANTGKDGQKAADLQDAVLREMFTTFDAWSKGMLEKSSEDMQKYVTDRIKDLEKIRAAFANVASAGPVTPGPSGRPPAPRQAGGPVWPGSSFLVGEGGPELFRPQRAGDILPLGGAIAASTAGGRSITLNAPLIGSVTVRDEADEDRLARKIWGLLTDDFEATRRGGVR